MTQQPRVPVVIYAAKSSPDDKDSCESQIAEVLARIEREPGRFVYADPFAEADVSGFSRSRGEELERAIQTAGRAAAEHDRAELWVFHSSRLARGSGQKGEARALGQLFYDCLQAGVTLRSAEDDPYVTDEAFVGMASKMSHQFSRNLSSHVRRGKRRQFEQGEPNGGPVPEGYARKVKVANGKIVARWYVIDTAQAGWIKRGKELALEGLGSPAIARALNTEGYRDRNGKPLTPNRVAGALRNPFYAGRIVFHRGQPDEEVRPGKHPAIIPPDEFDRIQELRASRAPGHVRKGGRKSLRFVLAHGLARCDRCGATMKSVTANGRIRKDGTRTRYYVCENTSHGTTACDQPKLDAGKIDTAVVAHLDHLFIDFDAWLQNIADAADGQRRLLEAEHNAALTGLDRHIALEAKLRHRYVEAVANDDPNQRAAEDALNRVLIDGDRLREQVRRAKESLAAADAEPPIDAMLDVYGGLRRAVRTGDNDGNVAELRAKRTATRGL